MAESGLSTFKYTLKPLIIKSILDSIVVIIPVCHTGDYGYQLTVETIVTTFQLCIITTKSYLISRYT